MIWLPLNLIVLPFRQKGTSIQFLSLIRNQTDRLIFFPSGRVKDGEPLTMASKRILLGTIGSREPRRLIDLKLKTNQRFADELILTQFFAAEISPLDLKLNSTIISEGRWINYSTVPLLFQDQATQQASRALVDWIIQGSTSHG